MKCMERKKKYTINITSLKTCIPNNYYKIRITIAYYTHNFSFLIMIYEQNYKHYTPPLLQNLIIFQAFKKNCCLYFLPVKSVNKSKNTIRFFFAECENQNCRVVSMVYLHSPLPKYGIPSKFFSSSLTFCYKLVVDSKPN